MRKDLNIYSIINSFAGTITSMATIFLTVRFILRLFNANPKAKFVEWIYETSRVLLNPFLGIFPNSRLEGGFVIEFNTLFAILIYLILYMLIAELLRFFSRITSRIKET